jgi:hypothetical protein
MFIPQPFTATELMPLNLRQTEWYVNNPAKDASVEVVPTEIPGEFPAALATRSMEHRA